MGKMCRPSGGFFGRITGEGDLDEEAPVGGIMTARILWTFASAYRIFMKPEYLETALRAKEELIEKFHDKANGGIFWSISSGREPLDTKKQTYAIAFAIYGLAELYRACSDLTALDYAVRLFNDIEKHAYEPTKGGYLEAFKRDWSPLEDMRLSEKDINECKTTNTHLHILEAYTALYRVWKNPLLESRLRELICIFTRKIIKPDGHLRLFFDNEWECRYGLISYGHEIETSWLLQEAAEVLADEELLEEVIRTVPVIVRAASEGFSREEGMIYEKDGDEIDRDRHWWVQAESLVGYLNLWKTTQDPELLDNALALWDLIGLRIIDRDHGEWFWSIRADGSANRTEDKAGFWKCPYHSARMCMYIHEHI